MEIEKIVSCEYIGEFDSMDIEVDSDEHIFYGDGIATSNSHAVSYSLVGYWTAYAKYHFSIEFFTSWLSLSAEKILPHKEVSELVSDVNREKLDILCPDFRVLNRNFITDGKVIRFGLTNVKGIGESVLEKIIDKKIQVERVLNKSLPQWGWLDILFAFSDYVNSKAFTALILAGGLDYLNLPRNTMVYEYDKWNQLTEKEKSWILNKHIDKSFASLGNSLLEAAVIKKEGGAASNVNRLAKIKDVLKSLDNPPYSIIDTPDRMAFEENKLLGSAITCSVLDSCDTARANTSLKEILDGKSEDYMAVALEIKKIRVHTIAKGKSKGQKMAFLTVSDGQTENDNIVAFSDSFKKYAPLLVEGNTVVIRLKRSDKGSLLVEAAYQC
jgi:DNA polymerase III alpha subunit